MKLRRTLRFHGLKRPRVRQTWNKYNLFNLARLRMPSNNNRTFFQQKWTAKALTRGYHGEHIKEVKWERMFSRRLLSVVDMDPGYMAAFDGSEQAAGRGSGREEPDRRRDAGEQQPGQSGQLVRTRSAGNPQRKPTPYVQMTYAPMERRLDIAIFRSLFASSARQARQFCVHGAVRVNGRKMIYPGYLLNPGDMFQVDPDMVMYATGRPKGDKSLEEAGAEEASVEDEAGEAKAASESVEEVAEADAAEGEGAAKAEEAAESEEAAEELEAIAQAKDKAQLKELLSKAKEILADPTPLSGKRKQALRAFTRDVRTAMSKATQRNNSTPQSHSVVDNLTTLLQELEISPQSSAPATSESPAATSSAKKSISAEIDSLTEPERERLEELLALEAENPYDPSKPYGTPWAPRRFMSPFAFIPRYLEVNQNICAAVYLRHPVARPGLAEVPTPFPPELNQLAFNWYLRRR